jgi:predicted DNA-binding protein
MFEAHHHHKEESMSSMVLTQVYLEPIQKKALSSLAKKTGRSVSELIRDAIDAAIAGVTTDELKTLDHGTRKAQVDIQSMLTDIKANTDEHKVFMREMAKLQKAAAKEYA